MKLAAIHHVAIIVSDYEKAREFYVNKYSTNRCYMEANTTMQQRFFFTVFSFD